MKKHVKSFIFVFLLVGMATFVMWYLASGHWVQSLELGIVGGTVVTLIVNLAIPFIKNQKNRRNNS